MNEKKLVSVISPVYGAEKFIDELVRQIEAVMSGLGYDYEIVLVEDCGPDRSWEKIRAICEQNTHVRGTRLSRNFGQHFAITAGIDIAKGDYLIVMDCDLQDDPKYIPELLMKAEAGFDIVYTLKKSRKHSFFKNITAHLFNVVYNYLIDNKSISGHNNVGAYSLITKKVADGYRSYNDYRRHYLAVLRWLGFRSAMIDIEHRERHSGSSGYNFSRLIKHAMDGITSQSDKLLRIFVTIGLTISVLSFATILVIVILYLTRGFKSGWASTISVILFSTGMILTGIGVLGVYLGRTFEQSKNRPKYLIDEQLN